MQQSTRPAESPRTPTDQRGPVFQHNETVRTSVPNRGLHWNHNETTAGPRTRSWQLNHNETV